MATRSKKPTGKTPPGKLAGKTVAFVGKFGYADIFLEGYKKYARAAGGKVVNAESAAPDYLVAGEGRGGNPPGAVAKIQKKHPAVEVLDEEAFCRLLLPSRAELLAELRSGRRDHERWEELERTAHKAGTTFDLAGADLRKADLYAAHLRLADLEGADLRGASGHYAHFGELHSVNCDDADFTNAYLAGAGGCSFRKATLTEVWLSHNSPGKYQGCDFSRAKFNKVNGRDCVFVDCTFTGADLSDADLEEATLSGADLSGANLSRAHCSECKLDGTNLARAVLHRADLRDASLAKADLRDANLRDAVLTGADLRGAKIEGADFAGAVLTGTKIDGLDMARAKNFQPPVVRQPGHKMRELAQTAAGAKKFETSVEVELGKGEHAVLALYGNVHSHRGRFHGRSDYRRDDDEACDILPAPTVEQGMFNLAARWPGATLRLDTIQASGCRSPRGKQLLDLATAAWAEAFGLEAASPEELAKQKAGQQAAAQKLRETMLKELRGGPAGVKKWNVHSKHEFEQLGPLHNLDLKGAKLDGIVIERLDLQGSNFEGASLKNAKLWSSKFKGADFTRANLQGAIFDFSDCEDTSFEGAKMAHCKATIAYFNQADLTRADLTGADLSHTAFLGTDFTGAKLGGVDFDRASYDAATKFPEGFTPPETMSRAGPPPGVEVDKPAAPGSMDFEAFYELLGHKIEDARLSKAAAMLKAERFQLFADVKDDALVGVVKSQSDPNLVYSCRLTADGKFSCCTQNLNACGGLRGALCKHLLVLVIGLARAGQVDPATVDAWILASKSQKPVLDKDVMSETFIRYKGAEAGEVDWRPTETIPEDYYAL
jgi:uncharacterized protein YjbI with pentapeptide repeats